ncbi:MAG: hypothetical protein GX603_03155 [Chloroflexi bacterium]|nr:hypothetical protein [Chloroflexota bacterium]
MLKKSSLIKPNINTKFRIDFDWWISQDRNWRSELISYLCPEHRDIFSGVSDDVKLDLVDPETGEVTHGDGLIHTLITHCAQQEDFITPNAPLVDTVFKVFLSRENQPMSAVELSEIIKKPSGTILSTIGSMRVYKGIRPV